MWKYLNLVVLQLTVRLCPACEMLFTVCFPNENMQFKQTIEMNEHSLPETISVTFEFSGVCNLMQNTAH